MLKISLYKPCSVHFIMKELYLKKTSNLFLINAEVHVSKCQTRLMNREKDNECAHVNNLFYV